MKYTVKMSCGHEQEVDIYGKISEHKNKIEYFETQGLCKECYKAMIEEQKKAMGLVLTACVLRNVDEDGDILVSLQFSGDTKSHKDIIKSLGYIWNDRESIEYCWNKTVKLNKVNEELKKASVLGDIKLKKNQHYASAALENQQKWKEQQANKVEIKVPEIIKGRKWNQKIYGKAGNYSIYPDGVKTQISDEQAEELKKYLEMKGE